MPSRHWFAALLMAALAAAPAAAQDEPKVPEKVARAQKQVTEYLEKVNGNRAMVSWVDDKSVAAVFPDQTFFSVLYRQYPVNFAPPEGLNSSNVFVVDAAGKAHPITTNKALTAYFMDRLGERKVGEKEAEQAVRAYLSLAQPLAQDGFYGFETVKAEAVKEGGKILAAGRSLVTKGGNGEITVKMTFADGSVSIGDAVQLRPGPRPICQATKLLDEDRIVRRMAEADLLFMGRAAFPYLAEQRAKAAPPLRAAIDRLWDRIESNGW